MASVGGDKTPGESPAACFGFRVHSTLPLQYLRYGDGQALEILGPSVQHPPQERDLLVEWLPRPGRPLHARLYAEGSRYHLWNSGDEWFVIDPPAGQILLPESPDVVGREERLWGIPAALCYLHRGDLPLHAAAVQANGRAMLLAGPGRFGKTTLAAAFHEAGFRLLSEDQSCVRYSPEPAVIPGPAMLRVRRDVLDQLRLPGAYVVAEQGERVSFALDLAGRGDCRPVPLASVVFLRRSTEGIRLERVPSARSVPDLWAVSFRMQTPTDLHRSFTAITALAWDVPVWNLYRPLRAQDLQAVVERVVLTCLADG